jgi:hypothetical protein
MAGDAPPVSRMRSSISDHATEKFGLGEAGSALANQNIPIN